MRRYFFKNDQKYVIRFFEAGSALDLADLVATVNSPGVQRWMDNVSDFSTHGFQTWMNEKGQENSFLFAIADMENENGEGRVHGFVYFYPREGEKDALEVSYAKKEGGPSGLIAEALHLSAEIVRESLSLSRPWIVKNLKFIAEIEEGNKASIAVAEKAGFRRKTGFDSKLNALWELSSRVLEQEEIKANRLGRVRQINGSYCGPAVFQIMASHFGVPVDQEAVVIAAGLARETVLKRGMSVAQMAVALKNLMPDYTMWQKMDSSLDDIEKMVRIYNYPVGVNWQGVFENMEYHDHLSLTQAELQEDNDPMLRGEEGHYSVVVDLDRSRNFVRIMDPYGHYSLEDRFIRTEEFAERWWDDRFDFLPDGSKSYFYAKQLMFAIVPKGVRAPEEVGMVEVTS